MKNNTIDTSKIFEEYVVGESVNAVNGYAGIITGVEVNKSLVSNGIASQNDYTVTITILVDVEDGIKQLKKNYRYIFTKGRKVFQNFITAFGLIKKNENGESELRLDLLLGRICEISFGTARLIEDIAIPVFDDEETKKEITVYSARLTASARTPNRTLPLFEPHSSVTANHLQHTKN